jgi:uncharacterized protein YjdB
VVRVEEDPNVPGIAILIGTGQGVASVEARVGAQRAAAAVQVVGGGPAGPPGAPPVPVGTGTATLLQIEPGSVFLLPSEDVQLQARFMKDDGSPAAPVTVAWRSLRPDVATVTGQGSVVGVSPGPGVIEAVTGSGLLARVTVQVTQTEFGFRSRILAVSPNQSDTVRVTVPAQNNRSLSNRRLVWRSMNAGVARVSPVGVVTGVAAGTTEIIATGFGQESRFDVTVHRQVEFLDVAPPSQAGPVAVPLGGSVQFTATPLAEDETAVPEAPVTWSLPDTAVAAFDPASGMLRGKQLGETKLTARAPGPGLSATWDVAVIAGGLVLDTRALAVGMQSARQILASFTDESGRAVSPATGVTWISSDPGVVEVDDEGNLTPRGFGSARVAATTPWGATDTASVYVQGEILITSTRGGSADIYSFDREQPEVMSRMTDRPGSETEAAYSLDGTMIAYVSDVAGNPDIFVARADGSDPVQLTFTLAFEGGPAWTADGSQIVYESDAGGSLQLWRMNADGSDARQLTDGDASNMQPAVSPDGQTIAFTSTRDRNYEVYLMNLDGSNQRNFTSSPLDEALPTWIGDSAIAFLEETKRGRSITRRIARLNFSRELVHLTPEGLAVNDFAIAPSGDLAAVIVVAQGQRGAESRLYLLPLAGSATAVEVPRQGTGDQLMTPSFRR